MLYTLAPERPPKTPQAHWASSLVGCLREAWYKWMNAPITNPTSLIQRQKMEAGDDDKETFARKFRERCAAYGVHVLDEHSEFPITAHLPALRAPIRGKIDLIYTIYDTRNGFHEKKTIAIEFKSTAGYGTKSIVGYHDRNGQWITGDLNDHPQYLAQVWAYMKFCPLAVDEWFLIAWDRESRLHATYVLREYEEALWWTFVPRVHPTLEDPIRGTWRRAPFSWEKILERLVLLEHHLALREPPPRYDPVLGHRYCAHVVNGQFAEPPRKAEEDEIWWKCYSRGKSYCQYASLCWGLVSWEEAEALGVREELEEEEG